MIINRRIEILAQIGMLAQLLTLKSTMYMLFQEI